MRGYLNVVFFLAVASLATSASAGCMDCCLPPPYNAIRCCSSIYDGGTGCIIYSGACKRPAFRELRVVRVEIVLPRRVAKG